MLLDPNGLSGDYSWGLVFKATSGSKTVVSKIHRYSLEQEYPSSNISAMSLSPSDRVDFTDATYLENFASLYPGYTISTEFYRTKSNGSSFYLRDSEATEAVSYVDIYDELGDNVLGALYVDGVDDHSAPPNAHMGVIAAGRMFLLLDDKLYYSMPGKFEYFPPLNFVEIPAQGTAITTIDDKVVVFSKSNIWVYIHSEPFGELVLTHSPVGTTHDLSVDVTDSGVYFMRDDGFYVFDGVTSRRIGEDVLADTKNFTGDRICTSIPDSVYIGSASGGMTAETGSVGSQWTNLDIAVDPVRVLKSADSTVIYGVFRDNGSIYIAEVFSDSYSANSLHIKTKDFGVFEGMPLGKVLNGLWCYIDYEQVQTLVPTPTVFTVNVIDGNSHSEVIEYYQAGRRTHRFSLPQSMIGRWWNLEVVGPAHVHGLEVEVY